jgi:multidrug efflux pump subunit AcrA (membrane-fusion protein)
MQGVTSSTTALGPSSLRPWLALLFLWLSACNSNNTPTTALPPPPPAVTVATSERRDVTDNLTVTARIDAVSTVELRPRVSGHITEVRFVAGQLVHQGDVLFVIDRRWYKADYDRTIAEVARASATLGNAQRISHSIFYVLVSKVGRKPGELPVPVPVPVSVEERQTVEQESLSH